MADFDGGKFAVSAGSQIAKREGAEGGANEAEGGVSDGGGHAAHLPVLAFGDDEFNPGGGKVGAVANGRVSWRKRRVRRQEPHLRCPRPKVSEVNPGRELIQRFLWRDAFYLCPVSLRVEKTRIC